MNSPLSRAVSACAITLISISAHAALVSRLGGQAYYDTVLNITWLADANLAASNTFGVGGISDSGSMNWITAKKWVAAMNEGTGYLGFKGWRLPTVRPINGISFDMTVSADGTTDHGTTATTTDGSDGGWRDGSNTPVSEMGYMYYVNLANLGACDPSLPYCTQQTGWGLDNTGPFSNVHDWLYWSSTKPRFYHPWTFDFGSGSQFTNNKGFRNFVWAVRSGDVSVLPERLSLSTSTNQTNFSTGDILDLTIGASNPSLENDADVYAVILLPDGDTMVNFTDLNANLAFGNLSDIGGLVPSVTTLDLANPFSVSLSSFFEYTWGGGEPSGKYTAYLVMAQAESLRDGSIDRGDILAASSVDFFFSPECLSS